MMRVLQRHALSSGTEDVEEHIVSIRSYLPKHETIPLKRLRFCPRRRWEEIALAFNKYATELA
jgi:hypothetical protein